MVNCLLIACFIGNISAKKYQNPFTSTKYQATHQPIAALENGSVDQQLKLTELCATVTERHL